MNNLTTISEIKENPEKHIKWMCYDVYITADLQVVSLSFNIRKEILRGGSYCFFCNGKYRTKKWIKNNCVNIVGFLTK